MTPRRPARSSLFSLFSALLFLQSTLVSAQDTFDCHLTIDSLKYDLTSLSGEHTISRTRETPPTSWLDKATFNLCDNLKIQDGVAAGDQCPDGTRACLTKTNTKGSNSDRVVAVIPLAQSAALKPEYSSLSSSKGISLVLHGSPYPIAAEPIPQSFNLTLLCSQEASEPKFISYDGVQLKVEWSAPAGCSESQQPPKDDESKGPGDGGKEEESVGSGIGWFFLVLLIAFGAYFGLGAYYNYSTYGARGLDLIPHRDFWREVPYMLRDVVSHLCSTVRPRRSSRSGGYIAV
ncbi:hypothetical protein JAAARDRAFT_177653 [Jaapia argillacea MUCL 33604]|uniref:Autophagy-related protein 27 n=1 Tax=Jaapia argillacea MUCL 33604 TaxID=933084 RepID=A0A067Q4G6_9AGAM|nr:hypothetical protein JAAARDRAFT_177653 [Jaapia argillacea MUCL 33604]